MSEMVDRAARALFEADQKAWKETGSGILGADLVDPDTAAIVRTVIEAMREPTDAMAACGERAPWSDHLIIPQTHEEARGLWQAMIDAALKP